jgi:hypothetical protein
VTTAAVGGRVVDPGALSNLIDGIAIAVAFMAVAEHLGITLLVPDVVWAEVTALRPTDSAAFAQLRRHPMVIVPYLTPGEADGVLRSQQTADVFDGPAGVVSYWARSRGWTILTGDPDRIRHVDRHADLQRL